MQSVQTGSGQVTLDHYIDHFDIAARRIETSTENTSTNGIFHSHITGMNIAIIVSILGLNYNKQYMNDAIL